MKKTFGLLASLILLGGIVLADSTTGSRCPRMGEDAGDTKSTFINDQIEGISKDLSLDQDQLAKVKTILEDQWEEKVALQERTKRKMGDIQATADEDLKMVLTPEQQTKMDELVKNKPECCPTPWIKCEKCAGMKDGKKRKTSSKYKHRH